MSNSSYENLMLELNAEIYAVQAHEAVGHRRKYTGEPYWIHLEEVANLVKTTPYHTSEMVAAAWLHDTLEDTEVTYYDLIINFGPEVANLVKWLTDDEKGNRATRKALSAERLAQAPVAAQTIKLADLISNTKSIVQHDPGFAKVYLEEKRKILEVMIHGDSDLLKIAKAISGIPYDV